MTFRKGITDFPTPLFGIFSSRELTVKEFSKAETEREAARQKKIAEYRKRLVGENTLLIMLTDRRSVSINTTNIFPLEGIGTVYPTARVTDDWGILEVSNGALMIHESGGRISKIYVSAPTDPKAQTLKGDGWTLQLSPGWELVPAQRKGDYFLKNVEKITKNPNKTRK